MLVLFETPAGYALFQLSDESKLEDVDSLTKSFATPEKASKLVKLKAFKKFDDMDESLAATTALVKSKLHKTLQKFLEKNIVKKSLQDKLAVLDQKLGQAISEKLNIPCVYDKSIQELQRGIRNQLSNLISDIDESDMHQIGLGLSHSLSRYKLKFSPDKVDTMIVQAIGLLDDLDKELNTYAMRVREWYGWHFPEMGKIVTDNIHYAKTARKMGMRTNAQSMDFSEFLPEDQEEEMKLAAQISMGTEVSETDIAHVSELCDQVVSISEYRAQLFEYLCKRMQAVAPNLTVLVGELVGARLISHAGSLMSLAKQPASTVQILGAEKALFRALKTKVETPNQVCALNPC
jgi:nucleolar protein 58